MNIYNTYIYNIYLSIYLYIYLSIYLSKYIYIFISLYYIGVPPLPVTVTFLIISRFLGTGILYFPTLFFFLLASWEGIPKNVYIYTYVYIPMYIYIYIYTSWQFELFLQGSLNYPFWGDQTMQIYGSFEGFPL